MSLLASGHYEPFSPHHCDCADCGLLRRALPSRDWCAFLDSVTQAMCPVEAPPQQDEGMEVERSDNALVCARAAPDAAIAVGHNLRPRYMGPLDKYFNTWDLARMDRRTNRQIAGMVRLTTRGRQATGKVGAHRDFVLTIQRSLYDSDGLPTLDVLNLAWVPYAVQDAYWKTDQRLSSLHILLALERAAHTIHRRVRLVNVHVDRLREYFMQLRGYQPQSDDPLSLIDKL